MAHRRYRPDIGGGIRLPGVVQRRKAEHPAIGSNAQRRAVKAGRDRRQLLRGRGGHLPGRAVEPQDAAIFALDPRQAMYIHQETLDARRRFRRRGQERLPRVRVEQLPCRGQNQRPPVGCRRDIEHRTEKPRPDAVAQAVEDVVRINGPDGPVERGAYASVLPGLRDPAAAARAGLAVGPFPELAGRVQGIDITIRTDGQVAGLDAHVHPFRRRSRLGDTGLEGSGTGCGPALRQRPTEGRQANDEQGGAQFHGQPFAEGHDGRFRLQGGVPDLSNTASSGRLAGGRPAKNGTASSPAAGRRSGIRGRPNWFPAG